MFSTIPESVRNEHTKEKIVADKDKPKNPNLRKFTPKAGPNSMGYKRRSKSSAASDLAAGRVKPLMDEVRIDKIVMKVDATRDALNMKLSKYPQVLKAVEFTLDRYTNICRTSGHRNIPTLEAVKDLERNFSDKLTPKQLWLAKRAFKEELVAH